MARKSPVELRRMALDLHRQGHTAERIADLLGLHPGSIHNLVGRGSSHQKRAGAGH